MMDRPLYMKRLLACKDSPEIKVLTGIRRVGKSVLLDLFEKELVALGVGRAHILRVNLENLRWRGIRSQTALYDLISRRIPARERTYLLMDEVQAVEDWELAVAAFAEEFDVDIYLTGSHASILPQDTGLFPQGFAEIPVLPLSFKEFQSFFPFPEEIGLMQRFDVYLQFGGMPSLSEHPFDETKSMEVLDGTYSSALMQDVLAQNRMSDNALLRELVRLLADTMGEVQSMNALSKQLARREGAKLKLPAMRTVESYAGALVAAGIFSQVPVYDIRGKKPFQRLAKHYITDLGHRALLLGVRGMTKSVLEQVVYFELLRLGVQVSAGRVYEKDVDFIARWGEETLYIQVAESMSDQAARKRALEPLRSIPDQHMKWVLTLDKENADTEDGIRISNLLDFLMDE